MGQETVVKRTGRRNGRGAAVCDALEAAMRWCRVAQARWALRTAASRGSKRRKSKATTLGNLRWRGGEGGDAFWAGRYQSRLQMVCQAGDTKSESPAVLETPGESALGYRQQVLPFTCSCVLRRPHEKNR